MILLATGYVPLINLNDITSGPPGSVDGPLVLLQTKSDDWHVEGKIHLSGFKSYPESILDRLQRFVSQLIICAILDNPLKVLG